MMNVARAFFDSRTRVVPFSWWLLVAAVTISSGCTKYRVATADGGDGIAATSNGGTGGILPADAGPGGIGDASDALDAPRDFNGAGDRIEDGGSPPDTGAPTGTPATLSISPDTKDFGTVVAGLYAEASFQVSNGGGQSSSVPTVTVEGTDAPLFTVTANGCMAAVPALGNCLVTVRFSPAAMASGTKSARINVNATLGGAVSATMQGMVVPPGALTITPTSQTFGSLLVGVAGAPVSFTVKNTGGVATGALATVVQNSTELGIASDGCKLKLLGAGESCVITVVFTPTSAGQKSGTLVVNATPGGTASASMTGTGLSPALLTIDPVSGSFATTTVNSSGGSQTFVIANTGGVAAGETTAVLAAVGGTNPGDFALSANGCTGTLVAGGRCMVTITFKPSGAGPRSATLTASATPGGSVTASLSGAGVNAALLKIAVASGASTNFGSVTTGTSATQTFTVTNTGGQASSAITIATAGAGFSVVAPSAGDCVSGTTTLAINASCNVHVLLSSTTLGTVSGSITATASAGGSSSLTLSGAIVSQGSISVTPTTAAFGSFLPGIPSAPISFSVKNDGGSTTPVLATAITGSTEFTISADSCNTKTLATGASCSVSVVFKPASPGGKTGSLSVTAGIAGVAAATLTGTGLVPATLELSAATSFGSIGVTQTSAVQVLTLRNSGDATAGTTTAIVPGLTGINASEFAVTATTCGPTLPTKGTCTVSVAFKPTSAGANKTATLTVSGAPGGAPTTGLTGTGLGAAALHLSVGSGFSNEFGSLVLGNSQTEQFVVTNSGQQNSSALTITLTGTDFSRVAATGLDCVSGTTTLAVNASCTVRVTFTPTAALSRTATLSVSATNGGSDSLTTLHGAGVTQGALAVSTATLDLGSVLQGGKSNPPAVITVRNTGGVASGLINTAIPAGEFTITSDQCKGIALGPTLTCPISVMFSPTTASATVKTSTLTVSASPGGSPTVALSGRGTTLQIDQTSFAFPATATGTAGPSRSFTVTNPTSGSAGTTSPLVVSLTGPNAADFQVNPGTCTGVLGGTGLCSTVVSFRPQGASFGLRTATLNVTANPGGTATVMLTGQGQAPDGQFGCVSDNDCQSLACLTYYRDGDGDGFGDPNKPQKVCGFNPPNGYVNSFMGTDCDDLDVTMFPTVSRCQSATVRIYCQVEGVLLTQTCGGACRDNACVGTANVAGTFNCSGNLSCTTAQGCSYANGFGEGAACNRLGPEGADCDDGSDCPAGSVCCDARACVAFIGRRCSVGACPVGDSCTGYRQVCNPLASDCPAGMTCGLGVLLDSISGQGRWTCN